MRKILIIQNIIPHYRISFYNELSKKYNLVVIHSGSGDLPKERSFKDIKLSKAKIGSLNFQLKIFSTIRMENPAVIIAMFDIYWPITILLLFKYRKKMIWWGLDEGKSKIALKIKLLISKLGVPIIFYHKSILKKFLKLGISKDICFTANNTFYVEQRIHAFKYPKKHFLFVGTIRRRKELDKCLEAFIYINNHLEKKIKFIVIGDGPQKNSLEEKINKSKNSNFISFHGQINNPMHLKNYYKNAIASISYGQAGLSVLQSFAYGVPYITKRNSISGGEANNIIHDYNGILLDSNNPQESLIQAMKKLTDNQKFAQDLGENAFNYYSTHCTIDKMVEGFCSAIEKIK